MKKISLLLAVFLGSFYVQAETFIESAQEASLKTLQEILTGPFIEAVENGTLSEAQFKAYADQDSIYILKYSEALGALSRKAPNIQVLQFLLAASSSTAKEWKGELPSIKDQCQSCREYSDFEKSRVDESYPAGIAALLPCYTVYLATGLKLAEQLKKYQPTNEQPCPCVHADQISSSEEPQSKLCCINRYALWMEKYYSEDFEKKTKQMIEFANKAYETASKRDKEAMIFIYSQAVKFEKEFFQSAYDKDSTQSP